MEGSSLEDLLGRAESLCAENIFVDIRAEVNASDFTADTAIAVREALRRQIHLANAIIDRLGASAAQAEDPTPT